MDLKVFIQSNRMYLVASLLLFLFLLMSVTLIYVPNRVIKVEENGDLQLLLKDNNLNPKQNNKVLKVGDLYLLSSSKGNYIKALQDLNEQEDGLILSFESGDIALQSNNEVKLIHFSNWLERLSLACIISLVFFYFVKKQISYKLILILLGAFFLVYTLMNPPFNAYDEYQHFDIINSLVKYCEYPDKGATLNRNDLEKIAHSGISDLQNHEVSQPPLYYLITAGLTKFMGLVDDVKAHFYLSRILSAIYVFLGVLFILHTVPKHERFLLILITGIFLSTAVLCKNFLAINNDPLLFLFNALILYFVMKWEDLIRQSIPNQLVLGLLFGAIFLTKLTGVSMIVAFGAVLLYDRKLSKNYMVFLSCGLYASVWFIYNFLQYDTAVLTDYHAEIIIPSEDRRSRRLHFIEILYCCSRSFAWGWFDEFGSLKNRLKMKELINYPLNLASWIAVGVTTFNIFRKKEEVRLLLKVGVTSLFSLFFLLVYISFTTPLIAVNVQRYYYFLAPWMITIVYYFYKELFYKYKKIGTIVLLFILFINITDILVWLMYHTM